MEKTILLVDDEEDIRDVVGISLRDFGYEVYTAADGEVAFGLFEEVFFPIVLTDIKMPGLDGIDLLRKIKNENPDTEVIMLTGHADMDLAIKSLKYEATDFITKPINVDALEIALKRASDKILTRQKLKAYTENLESLIKEKTELQNHLSSLGLMISSISHGIKGLLTGLDGGMYILNAGFSTENHDKMKEGWEVVKTVSQRIRKLVMDILFYAKERDLNWENVDVLHFVKNVALIAEQKAKEKGIAFASDFDSSLGKVVIDSSLIHSALINILDNAIDACTNDTLGKPHKVVFGVKDAKDHILFNVYDNGIGMDSETKDKIFTLFYSSKGSEGTGLGLFITHQIVEQHGGTIHVNSVVGQGSQFCIKLPKENSRTDQTTSDNV